MRTSNLTSYIGTQQSDSSPIFSPVSILNDIPSRAWKTPGAVTVVTFSNVMLPSVGQFARCSLYFDLMVWPSLFIPCKCHQVKTSDFIQLYILNTLTRRPLHWKFTCWASRLAMEATDSGLTTFETEMEENK